MLAHEDFIPTVILTQIFKLYDIRSVYILLWSVFYSDFFSKDLNLISDSEYYWRSLNVFLRYQAIELILVK